MRTYVCIFDIDIITFKGFQRLKDDTVDNIDDTMKNDLVIDLDRNGFC